MFVIGSSACNRDHADYVTNTTRPPYISIHLSVQMVPSSSHTSTSIATDAKYGSDRQRPALLCVWLRRCEPSTQQSACIRSIIGDIIGDCTPAHSEPIRRPPRDYDYAHAGAGVITITITRRAGGRGRLRLHVIVSVSVICNHTPALRASLGCASPISHPTRDMRLV